jgi:large subunit ribosomal protein L30
MATIKIKLVRSAINRPLTQKRTLEALGLKKLNQVVEHEATPSTLGQVAKVSHLVQVQEN